MQLDNKFTAFWMDTTTAPWTPLTGLSATITIREADAPYTVVVNAEAMTEMWWGHYIYVFSGMSLAKEYTYICNPWATAFIESGVTQNSLYQWIADNRSGWGGGYSVNLSGVTGSINNLTKLVKDESKAIKEHVTNENSETNSHIDIAKAETIDKIESIEIPETILEEKEAKKAIKLIQGVDKKLTSYIESEMKEKEEISEISSEFLKQELDDNNKKKQKEEEEKRMEAERDAKLLEEIQAEFDKADEEDRLEKKKELEKELEETLKEAEEIKKELKTL